MTTIDASGKSLGESRLVDSKPDALFVLSDGKKTTVVAESDRIHPDGYETKTYPDLRSAQPRAGVDWLDVMRLGKDVTDLDRLANNLGLDALELTDSVGGGIRVSFNLKNSNKVRAELDLSPECDFHVVACRVYNPGKTDPATTTAVDWRLLDGVWYVHAVTEEQRFPKRPVRKRVFEFEEFHVNPTVDPWLFTLDSVEQPNQRDEVYARHLEQIDGRNALQKHER